MFSDYIRSEPLQRRFYAEGFCAGGGAQLRGAKTLRRLILRSSGEEGNSLVEMALVSAFVFLPLIFGIIQFSFALYAYNFVNLVSRQATRYAAVRGVESCVISATFPNCNMGPDTASGKNATAPSALQTYVRSLAYPGINPNNLTVTTTYLARHVTSGAGGFSKTAWDVACTTTNPYNAQECNTPGNAVQVSAVYQFPLAIPFWKNSTLTLTGTSQMVINQ
jgi:hypothetical protein